MAKRIAISNLNASTLDILNTIRANASMEYQNLVPALSDVRDIPKVGELIYGYPNIANQFISALLNRIALVKIKSANFNNMYSMLKKGYLEYGETVEEVFVNIAKAREFSPEKAEAREFKRTIPDVRTAFHTMNWRVQYPVTIQDEDLRQAFVSAEGVQDLIARIVDAVYTANEYDEFLLFKYLIIKSVAHGKMYPVQIESGDIKNSAVAFRGTSNALTFMNTKYNASGVHTSTRKDDQYIFMDANFNAKYDVEVLASAFNMDRADFMGRLLLIDDFTTFDNDRFNVIRENSDMVEEVTATELALMANVKAVLVDNEFFQFYDNLTKFTETYVSSGMYWNYFLNVWKTVSYSPFSNAVVFVDGAVTAPTNLTFKVDGIVENADNTAITLVADETTTALIGANYSFTQTEALTEAGVAVHRYGAIIAPKDASEVALELTLNGETYTGSIDLSGDVATGDTVTFTKAD